MRKITKKGKIIALIILILSATLFTIFGISETRVDIFNAITRSNKALQYYDENTVFVLFTKYLDTNQSVIANTSVQTQTVDKLDYKIDIPEIPGYEPLVDKLEGTLDQEGIEYLESLDYVKVVVKDNIYNIYITITYDAAPSAYSIVYYEQDTDLEGYTEIKIETIGGTSGNYTGEIYTGDNVVISPEEKEGFLINTEKTKLTGRVEAYGAKTFEVYYDREAHYLYTYNTGDVYYEPMIIKYGQEIVLDEEPTYSGYIFDGWTYSTSMDGEKIDKPSSMPDYNIYAEAKWIKSDTHYTLSYYTQNPDDDGYTNIGTSEVAAVSGDNLKDKDQTDLKELIEDGFLSARGDTAEYYYYNEEKTKTENRNFDIVVEGKGVTVVPIYFDRHVYNITLDFDDDDYSTRAEVLMNGTTYTDSYTFQARYEQNLLEHWITADDFTTFPKGSRNYYFRGWKANGNSTTYVSLRLNLTSTMIEDADSDRNIVYYAQYATSSTSRDLRYLFESFDQETTTTSDTRVLYNGKYYEVADEYSQKVYSSSSMSAKEIAGVTNVGQKRANSTYQFFYDRNILKITLYNMNNVYVEKELKYGQSIEEFVNTQLNPEDFSLETPGTKDWKFEGWYQDSNYMVPMVWTNSDGSYKTMTDNLVLYAKWSAPTYTVTFNTNGGTWTETDSKYVKVDDETYTLTVVEGESLVKPSNPTKVGNIATAWNYDVNTESVEYLFSDSQKVYSDLILDLQYQPNMNIPYKVRYIEAQYKDGVLIEDISDYENIVDLAPSKEVYNNAYGSTVIEDPVDIYDMENEDNYFVVNLRSETLTLTSEDIDENVIYFLYAKNPIVPYTVYYVKYQEDANGNPIVYDYGDIPEDDVLLGTKSSTVAAGYATELADDIDGWTVNGSYSQTIKLTLKSSLNTMYFYYNQNTTGEYLINFFFMDENGEYSENADFTYTSEEAGGKILYASDFVGFTFENGPTDSDYAGRELDLNKSEDAYLIITTTDEVSAMDLYFKNVDNLSYTVKYQDEDGNKLLEDKNVDNQTYSSTVKETAPAIEGYTVANGENEKSIKIGLNTNEIIFTYVKRTDLEYTVRYLEQGSNTQIADAEIVKNQTYKSEVTKQAKDIAGYDIVNKEESITIEITGNEIIFYYTKRTDLEYTVRYLEQNTNTELETAKVVTGQTYKSTATEKAIDIDGYNKVKEEDTITIEATGNEIIFYYVKRNDLSYTVNYYEKGTTNELTESKIVDGQTFKSEITEEAIVIPGYDKVEPSQDTIIIGTATNVLNFYYEKRTDLEYTVKYLEQGTNVELKTAKIVTGQTYKSTATEKAIDIDGYDKVKEEDTITIEATGNEIIFYYTRKTGLSYKIEYYYNGEIDSNKTIESTATYLDVIDDYQDNIIDGYKLDRTENLPLTITTDENANVIKIYYVSDENQTKEISYTVEYYKENVLQEADTQVNKKVVQLLEDEVLTVDKNTINLSDKYFGYKLDNTQTGTIPDQVNNGDVIKVYYVIDDANTKDLYYTVEYYKENVLQETDTQRVETTVQILAPDTLDVNKGEINTIDKYFGYKLDKTMPEEIPNQITTGETIKVYYVIDETQTKELSYTIEYYKDGEKQVTDTKEITVSVQVLKPDTITVDTNNIETTGKYAGYKLEKTSPETIPSVVNNGDVIKIYYIKDEFEYTVEYYYDGVLDQTKTENNIAIYGDTIKEYTDKNITGYRLEKTENLPLQISRNEEDNVIKIYYIVDDGNTKTLNYTVEYYKDGVLQEGDTQIEYKTVQILQPDTFEVDKTKINLTDKYVGYKLEKTNPNPIQEVATTGDVIKVYYVKDDFKYTVEYYYEGVQDTSKTEELVGKFEEVIDTYTDKINEKYNLEKTENFPMKITEDTNNNVIKVYYTKKLSTITVHYYLNEESKTRDANTDNTRFSVSQDVVIKDKVDTVHTISQATDVAEKYELVKKPETEEITMTVEPIEVEYIYKLKEAKVIVNYIERGSGKKLSTQTIEGQVDDFYQTTPKTLKGYTYVSKHEPKNQAGNMTLEPITVVYYYDPIPQGNGNNLQPVQGGGNSNDNNQSNNINNNNNSSNKNKHNNGDNGLYMGDNEIFINTSIIIIVIAINAIQLTISYDGRTMKKSKRSTKRGDDKGKKHIAKRKM